MTRPDAPLDWFVSKASIKSLTLDELAEYFSTHGERPFRAKQVADWLYQKRVDSFAAMTDLPAATRDRLVSEFSFVRPEVVRVLGSKDTTRKFLFRLDDGNLIESVLIPASPALYGETSDRRTACVVGREGIVIGPPEIKLLPVDSSTVMLATRRSGRGGNEIVIAAVDAVTLFDSSDSG